MNTVRGVGQKCVVDASLTCFHSYTLVHSQINHFRQKTKKNWAAYSASARGRDDYRLPIYTSTSTRTANSNTAMTYVGPHRPHPQHKSTMYRTLAMMKLLSRDSSRRTLTYCLTPLALRTLPSYHAAVDRRAATRPGDKNTSADFSVPRPRSGFPYHLITSSPPRMYSNRYFRHLVSFFLLLLFAIVVY